MSSKIILVLVLMSGLLFLHCSGGGALATNSVFNPEKLEEGSNQIPKTSAVGARGKEGMVVGTTGAEAQKIGAEILKKGGNAMDAAIATAMGQIVLAGGSWVSFAGITNILVYDADTEKVVNINGTFNTVLGETDYQGVPSIGYDALAGKDKEGHHNGRTVAVPGFMKGMYEAHQKYGKLSWAEVLEPVIELAEKGFPINKGLASQFAYRKKILSRFEETKAVFTKADGSFYEEGDIFKQPVLAKTLRKVAKEGADYMYTGDWAKQMVKAVQGIGGRITMKDMANYKVLWNENPPSTTYNGFQVVAFGLPGYGGTNLIEGLNLIEASGINGKTSESAETVFWLTHLLRAAEFSREPGGLNEGKLLARRTKKHADSLWQKMEKDGGLSLKDHGTIPTHSDSVVTIDKEGNIVSMVHSINAVTYGETGLVIGGISIGDGLTNQLDVARQTKPGTRLPDSVEAAIILKNGRPHSAFSSIGAGLHQRMVTTIYNALTHQMTPEEALNEPAFGHNLNFNPGISRVTNQTITSGVFAPGMIERIKKLGVQLTVDPSFAGYVVGILIDPKTKERIGGTIEQFGGRPVGF